MNESAKPSTAAKGQTRPAPFQSIFHGLFLFMDKLEIAFWLTVVGTVCWGICFIWMHLISSRQNALLEKLQQQSRRIEELSKAEHDLIKEVHPQVTEIKDSVEEVADVVKENGNGKTTAAR